MTGWSGSCEVTQVSNDISVLEQSIHHHQSLYEAMCQAYTEVCYHLSYHLHILWLQLVTCFTCQTRANLVILNFTCLIFAGSFHQQEAPLSVGSSCPVDKCCTKRVSSKEACKFAETCSLQIFVQIVSWDRYLFHNVFLRYLVIVKCSGKFSGTSL